MAFSQVPTDWLANWSEDGTDITVPIATFPELTAAEADAATGDIRKIVFAIFDELYDQYAGTAEADRPTRWTMDRQTTVDDSTGNLIRTFIARFETSMSSEEVVAE